MPTFVYNAAGGVEGTLEAPDRTSALRTLIGRGEAPVSIRAADDQAAKTHAAKGTRAGVRGGVRGSMTRTEVATFTRELATGLRAGLPLVPALRTIAKQGHSPRQRVLIEALIHEVEHGRSLSEAFGSRSETFSELLISMSRAGEASGKIGEVLTHAAMLQDRDVKLRRTMLSATLYPMILAGLLTISVVIIVTLIVPRILAAAGPIRLPWPTRVVQGTADFFGSYWWVVLLACAGVYALFARVRSSPQGRYWMDSNLLKLPLLGRVLRDIAVARFTRTLATLTAAGIAVVPALRVTKATLGNAAMERVIDDVVSKVSSGRTIAQPMEESGHFPPMLVQIVNMGERSGKLEELLDQAAGAFEEKTEQSVKLFTAALPPVLVVVLAIVVGFVVLAILMALMASQDAAMR